MMDFARAGIDVACRGVLRREAILETMVRPSNGFLSALAADDYELLRPFLRTVELPHEAVLVETGETLTRAYFPHRGVISLVVKLARGEHVQVAMIGRDSLLGTLSTMGDAFALNTAIVLVPGVASMMDLEIGGSGNGGDPARAKAKAILKMFEFRESANQVKVSLELEIGRAHV